MIDNDARHEDHGAAAVRLPPGFDLDDETTGPGRPPEGALDAVGWTETTHVEWTLTLDRVGCGRTGASSR
jgi:hypothetical protein